MKERAPSGNRRRNGSVLRGASVLVLFLALVFSLCLGRYPLGPGAMLSSLGRGIGHGFRALGRFLGFRVAQDAWPSGTEDTLVWLVRMPRILAAVLAGSALSLSGTVYQGLFRNPMISPDILGVAAGASFGACLMMLLNRGYWMVQLGAFLMGLLAVALSYLLSRSIGRGRSSVLLLVLCGMTVTALFQALVSIVKYLADPASQLPEMTYWLMGSLAKVDSGDVLRFAVIVVVFSAPLLLLRWRLNALAFGDDDARMLGINAGALRAVCVVCTGMLTAAVIAMAGTIGWVGLMIPHAVRFLAGPDHKTLLPLSMSVGAAFLLVVDDLCRTLLPYEIPLGVLTAVLGVPFFILVLIHRNGGNV